MKRGILSRSLGFLFVLVLAAGCASAGGRESGVRTDVNRLTQEQLREASETNVYDIIQRLRPNWLRTRADRSFGMTTGIVVYQNQTLLGNLDSLRQISPEMIISIRYLDGVTASNTLPGLGSSHVDGAIVLETRGR